MLQTTTEPICYFREQGFEIFGISQELPFLKQFCESKGRSISEFFGNELSIKGFREYSLKKSSLRAFSFKGTDFPGEHRPLLSIITPVIERVDYLASGFSVSDPIGQIINEIERDNREPSYKDQKDWKGIHHEMRYAITILKIFKYLEENRVQLQKDLFVDLIAVLAEFYAFESMIMFTTYDEEFLKNLPESTRCPVCFGPGSYVRDGRSSKLCEKCRHGVKIQKQRERRGTLIEGERYCACGCGEKITGSPQMRFKNPTHARRKQGDRK